MTALSRGFEDVETAVSLALDCGASPSMVLAVAVMAHEPASVVDALDFLSTHRARLEELASQPRAIPKSLATIGPDMQRTPELARIRPDVVDHELRGQLVFRDLVGKKSFFQVAALAIAGISLEPKDAELLEHLGVNTQLADVGIWPLTVTRRIAMTIGVPNAIVGGLSAMLNPNMAVGPVAKFMQLLDRLQSGVDNGEPIPEQLRAIAASGEKLGGLGRPALGPDERNKQVIALAHQYGRDAGRSWRLAWEVDDYFGNAKGVRVNSAGLQAAIMRDLGFSPTSAMAFCVLYFMVPILAQAAFSVEVRD